MRKLVSTAFLGFAATLVCDIVASSFKTPGPHDALYWLGLLGTYGVAACWAFSIAIRTRRGASLASGFWLVGITTFFVALGAAIAPAHSPEEIAAAPQLMLTMLHISAAYVLLLWVVLITCARKERKAKGVTT
jgi:hypothetical protein